MINYFLGNAGHFAAVVSFVFALVACYAYYQSTNSEVQNGSWLRFGNITFGIHAFAVLGIIVVLYTIISGHYFEYHYAYSHSSQRLPVYYMISAFWEGQEGSFLLWIFWHVVLGVFLVLKRNEWTATVMMFIMAVQAFLSSMILGTEILGVKIGSSPFILLRDALAAPIFEINPDFIPEDGAGLNPLLQNYWMVIHPPTLFLGFATTVVPFAFCIGGLYKKDFSGWIKPALPWALFSAMVLGVGILMGAYWAYETLNFGGYWNWDPVENAVYIPWLTLVASYHIMTAYQKSKTGLKASMIMTITTFILILYSTFLTRSGILGDSSVHSFTDLGLSGQLLMYLLLFAFLSAILLFIRWRAIPEESKEPSAYTGEFWIFIGATILSLMAFQVLIPTSIPVFNAVVGLFGVDSNIAPPADQIAFYTRFQLWFAVALVLATGIGQLFWWKRVERSGIWKEFSTPLILTLIFSAVILIVGRISDVSYMIIVLSSVYSIVVNASIAFKLSKKKNKLSGGAIAHMGVALMLIGILSSSGYSNIVSLNNTGMLLVRDGGDELNKENVLLWYNEPRQMADYQLTYKGARIKDLEYGAYIDIEKVFSTQDPDKYVVKELLVDNKKVLYQVGDTLQARGENTYYEVEYIQPDGKSFTLYPRAQINEEMGGILASPDIRRALFKDLYTHVSLVLDPKREIEWSETEQFKVRAGETFIVNDYVAELVKVGQVEKIPDVELQEGDVAIEALIRIKGKEDHFLKPVYLIRGNMAGKVPDELRKLGLRTSFEQIIPEEEAFVLNFQTTQKEYVIMKAIEKPLINILWLGTLVLVIGFVVAIRRRTLENRPAH
jgi:cytochrome c-type biogenesis protein CcmF